MGAPLLNYSGIKIMFYVYVLKGEDGKHYVGYSSNLKRRVKQHQSGQNTSTKYQRWELIYYEAYKTESKARERERKLKHHGQVYQSLMTRLSE